MKYELRLLGASRRVADRFQFHAPSDFIARAVAGDMWEQRARELWSDAGCVDAWGEAEAAAPPRPWAAALVEERWLPRAGSSPDRAERELADADGTADAALMHWLQIRFGAL